MIALRTCRRRSAPFSSTGPSACSVAAAAILQSCVGLSAFSLDHSVTTLDTVWSKLPTAGHTCPCETARESG